MPARIMIVDDHQVVREGVKTLITGSHPDWTICGEAGDGVQAVQSIPVLQPDLVILDVSMPNMNGLEAAAKIADLNVPCRVLIFTMHESKRLAAEVRAVRAHGLVLKTQAARDLIRAIECLLAGGTFFGAITA